MLKLGFTSILIIALIFAGGFFTGYQRAANFYQFGSEVETMMLPEVETSLREQQTPEITVAGENIDVDQAESDDHQSSQNVVEKISVDSIMSGLSSDGQEASATESQAETVLVNNSSTAPVDIEKVKYSVQVGMYRRLINAKNMMKMLQAQQLDSYVSNYTNDKKEHRYNVRFGYFADKKTAVTQLKNYKNVIKGDGYLVRFSANNIVDFERIEKTEKTVAIKEKTRNQTGRGEGKPNNTQAPEATPLEVKLDKLDTLSRADILNM